MARPLLRLLVLLMCLAASPIPRAFGLLSNAVTDWNLALQSSLRTYNMGHQVGVKCFVLLHRSQHLVLSANLKQKFRSRRLNETLLVAAVSHYVLSCTFPDLQSVAYDGIMKQQTAGHEYATVQLAVKFSKKITLPLLSSRLNDGSQVWANFTPAAEGSAAGQYQFTPGQNFSALPQLGATKPFAATLSESELSRYVPDSVSSASFLAELEEVFAVGGGNSSAATDDTRATADFWADAGGKARPEVTWNRITLSLLPSTLSLSQTALFLAAINSAEYDANIVGWKLKYTRLFWRPVTAIRSGAPGFDAAPWWTPYLATPPHPEYPSGHSLTASSFGKVLQWFLGGDSISPTLVYTEGRSSLTGLPLPPRTYTSISSIVDEVSMSRIYAGVHFKKAVRDAESIGSLIAKKVIKAFYGVQVK